MSTPAQSLIQKTAADWFSPEPIIPETPNQKAILVITRAVYTAAVAEPRDAKAICLQAVADVEAILQAAGRTNLLDRRPKAATPTIET